MFSEKELENLKISVSKKMSERRFLHTLAVERCAIALGELFIKDRTSELRAAALLHDVAKELPCDELKSLMARSDFDFAEEDYAAEGILHSFAGAEVIKREYPEFATKDILNSVFYHTVGRENMTVFEKIIFISDYAEETRKYESCKMVRDELFYEIEKLSESERLKRLNKACHDAAEGTVKALVASGMHVNSRIYKTKNSLEF